VTPTRSTPATEWPAVLDEITGALESLISVLDHETDVRVLLQRVCQQLRRVVPGVDEASVTLMHATGAETAAATSAMVVGLDAEQYRTGEGPCEDAARTGQLIRARLPQALRLWPAFAARSRDAGMSDFLAAPLAVNDDYFGAVTCYSARGHGFTELDAHLLELYTTAVEALLRSHTRYLRVRDEVVRLGTALAAAGRNEAAPEP
jgi:transcriptional regulator with GAF, ATPase, and Fis domain